jgi:hypothetical protein
MVPTAPAGVLIYGASPIVGAHAAFSIYFYGESAQMALRLLQNVLCAVLQVLVRRRLQLRARAEGYRLYPLRHSRAFTLPVVPTTPPCPDPPRCSCCSSEPSPGVDVAGVSPVPVQMWPGEPGPGADVVAVGLFEVGHLSGSDSAKERGPTPVTIMART